MDVLLSAFACLKQLAQLHVSSVVCEHAILTDAVHSDVWAPLSLGGSTVPRCWP